MDSNETPVYDPSLNQSQMNSTETPVYKLLNKKKIIKSLSKNNIKIPSPPKDDDYIPRTSIKLNSKLQFNICNNLDNISCKKNDNIGILIDPNTVGLFNSNDICEINNNNKCSLRKKKINTNLESNFNFTLKESNEYLNNIYKLDGTKI